MNDCTPYEQVSTYDDNITGPSYHMGCRCGGGGCQADNTATYSQSAFASFGSTFANGDDDGHESDYEDPRSTPKRYEAISQHIDEQYRRVKQIVSEYDLRDPLLKAMTLAWYSVMQGLTIVDEGFLRDTLQGVKRGHSLGRREAHETPEPESAADSDILDALQAAMNVTHFHDQQDDAEKTSRATQL